MNRPRLGVISVAAMASAALMLAVGPALGSGSAGSQTETATPARCAGSGTTDEAGPSQPDPKAGPTHHPMGTLSDRLARTPSGGKLTVPPGVYHGALVIDHPVMLVGIGHAVLRGDGTGTVLTVRAAGTTVRNLVVEGSGPGPVGNPAGVSVQADNVVIKDLHIRDSYTGIWVEGASDTQILGNVIEGRESVAASGEPRGAMEADMDAMSQGSGHGEAQGGRGDGVSLFDAIRPVVSGNIITDPRDGVYMEFGSGTRIECNSVVGGRYAIHGMYGKSVTLADNRFTANQSGPVMMYGGPLTLEGNVIRDAQSAATGFGVLLLDVAGARLIRNVIVSNRVGLQIEGPVNGSRPTVVELNTIALNQVGVGLYPSANANLSQNSFVENTVQVLGLGPDGDGGASSWSREGVGNYWSDYRGYQRSGSDVGAIPHVEGAAAGRLLASDPVLLALASSPSFNLLRAVEQRTAGHDPVSVDRFPMVDPRSPSLSSTPDRTAIGTGLVGATILAVCSLSLLRCTRRRQLHLRRTGP